MANQRQIPHFHWQTLANGTRVGHWKPSRHLRQYGWTNRRLGPESDEPAITLAAIALNQQVAEWRAGNSALPAPQAPRRRTFADAVTAFCDPLNPDWSPLSSGTQRQYRLRLDWLTNWAMEGRLFLDQLDKAMVLDLKAALRAPLPDGTAPSQHKAAATLGVLRMFLGWCEAQGWIAANPAAKLKIHQPPARDKVLMPDQMAHASATATAMGFPDLALALDLSQWILQREGDLLSLNQLAWREIENCAPADRALLAGPDGKIMGFRLRQTKTGAWVDCPVPPMLHARIEAAFSHSQWLVPDARDPARPQNNRTFQRRIQQVLQSAGLAEFQFRDWRRSGMCMYRDLGIHDPTPISGHAILGKRSILDTYMPGHTRAACHVVAEALRTLQARERRAAEHG